MRIINLDAALQAHPEFFNEQIDDHDKAIYAKGWNDCNKEYYNAITELPVASMACTNLSTRLRRAFEADELVNQRLLLDAADAIEELLTAVPKWISVEEPPDNGRNIFICHGSADFKAPCIGHYEPNMKRFYEDKNWFASPIYDAMYWCEMPELPLPEPPKEVLPNGDV